MNPLREIVDLWFPRRAGFPIDQLHLQGQPVRHGRAYPAVLRVVLALVVLAVGVGGPRLGVPGLTGQPVVIGAFAVAVALSLLFFGPSPTTAARMSEEHRRYREARRRSWWR